MKKILSTIIMFSLLCAVSLGADKPRVKHTPTPHKKYIINDAGRRMVWNPRELRYEPFTSPYERRMIRSAINSTSSNSNGAVKWWDFYFNVQ